MWFVYILKSKIKKWFYVGSTNNIQRRFSEHNKGKVVSTKGFRPFDLVYKVEFDSEGKAREYERKLKKKRIEKEKVLKEL